jgi:hypothetical protein
VLGTFVTLMVALLLKLLSRDFFLANAHGKSAVLLFVFLWLAILDNARMHWRVEGRPWAMPYLAVLRVQGEATRRIADQEAAWWATEVMEPAIAAGAAH